MLLIISGVGELNSPREDNMKKAILFGLGTLAELVLHSNSFHKGPYDIVALTADPEFINIDALNSKRFVKYFHLKAA